MKSIRVNLEQDVLDRVDRVAGPGGRQRFIREAILWRLDREIPPFVTELESRLNELESRVSRLEDLHGPQTFAGELSDVVTRQVCRDDLERRILTYFLRHGGATTPELAEALLGDSRKRRTILSRMEGINRRATELLGAPLFRLEKGVVRGKRGAWWLTDVDLLRR